MGSAAACRSAWACSSPTRSVASLPSLRASTCCSSVVGGAMRPAGAPPACPPAPQPAGLLRALLGPLLFLLCKCTAAARSADAAGCALLCPCCALLCLPLSALPALQVLLLDEITVDMDVLTLPAVPCCALLGAGAAAGRDHRGHGCGGAPRPPPLLQTGVRGAGSNHHLCEPSPRGDGYGGRAGRAGRLL